MSLVTAFAVAEIVSMIAVGIATAGNALEGFGIAAISWACVWLALLFYASTEIISTGAPSYMPLICVIAAVGNVMFTFIAYKVECAVRTA
ncbi:hypothetical protein H7Y29_02520 [Microbacteriaceae bacterium]|nr:hypothetical protein [Candidatus Saccharibacteria bacterium]